MCQVFANASIVSPVSHSNALRGVGLVEWEPSCVWQNELASFTYLKESLGCAQATQACAVGSLQG